MSSTYAQNPYASASSGGSTLNPYSSNFSSAYSRRDAAYSSVGTKVSRFVKRAFKFPQMDFEVAVWEMTSLMISPRRVFTNLWYHKQTHAQSTSSLSSSDPAFTYLTTFFLLLASLAWSLAYAAPSAGNIIRIAFIYIFVHCLLLCLLGALASYILLPRLLGPRGVLGKLKLPRGRSRGLFNAEAGDATTNGGLEFSYCFDVCIRAYTPVLTYLYLLQFLLLPLLTPHRFLANMLSNTLHAVAFTHALYVAFLGYAQLPTLERANVLLTPIVGIAVFWIVATATGWSATRHLAPILWCHGGLRRDGVGAGGGAPVTPPPAQAVPVDGGAAPPPGMMFT